MNHYGRFGAPSEECRASALPSVVCVSSATLPGGMQQGKGGVNSDCCAFKGAIKQKRARELRDARKLLS